MEHVAALEWKLAEMKTFKHKLTFSLLELAHKN
jgi:hypothetical protein